MLCVVWVREIKEYRILLKKLDEKWPFAKPSS
jgi:hypothetical protein